MSGLGRRGGFTLIEMMVAVIVIALVASGVGYGFSMLDRTRLKSACMKLAAGARFAYARAVSQGTTVRLRFDLDQETMAIEEAHGFVTLARTDDARRAELDEDEEDKAGVDPWEAAKARLADTLKPSFGADPFSPVSGSDGQPVRRCLEAPLGKGIRIVKLFVQHEAEPRERGKGAIYFFRNGRSERAVIQLVDTRDQIYSVEIDPLTGRARVLSEAFAPEDLSEEETSDLEDRG